ncbi:MAG: hypothetical protein KJO07_04685, partial [Deltaproteobacteria bacterium]|nr:hypothetical protein [Deltaproteobacteria bacterium]
PDTLWAITNAGLFEWDGSDWTQRRGGTAYAVWGTSSDDIYASVSSTELQHWNGSSWTTVLTATVYDIHGAGPSDAYAVGPTGLASNSGGAWTSVALPAGANPSLWGVWANSAEDVYAVGNNGTIVHFDGAQWSLVSTPVSNALLAVTATGPEDVFAAGSFGTIVHFDGTAWSTMETGTSLDIRGIHAISPQDVYATTNSPLVLHYDGLSWAPVRTDFKGDVRGVWSHHNEVYLAGDDGYVGRLYRSATWGCSATESHCGDAIDNDCDGAIDSRDSDCQGLVQLSEIHAGNPDYVEIVNRGTAPASFAGLSLASSADCPTSTDLDFTLGEPRSLEPGGVWRVVDSADLQSKERYVGCNLVDNPDDSHWYALCAGPCDLESCYNMLDYVEKTDGVTPPAGPACASFSPAPADVSGEPTSTSTNSLQRTGYAGSGAAGQQADWALAPLSRD